jgi:predicted ABC-type ATPase
MLRRLRALAAARHSFAFETTLAGRTFAPWLAGLVATGYSFALVYFYLPSADLAIDRVALRVRTGGHHVPAETIRRRYERGLRNFFTLYSRVASEWHLYNNERAGSPVLVASGGAGTVTRVGDAIEWERLLRELGDGDTTPA